MLAAGLALAAAVVPNAVSAQQHPPGHGDGILPPGDWSPAQRDELLDMVEDAERDLPQFADPEDLPEEYIDFGVAVDGYWHFINWEMFDDAYLLDPNHPEALVYHREWNDETSSYGPFRLVSAMYILRTEHTMENLPEDLAWLPGLHTHPDICVNETTKKFAGLSGGGCPAGSRAFEGPPMMHVWIEDPGCDPPHRFGGIDLGGLHCEVHGHPGGPGGSTTTTTEHQHGSTSTTMGSGHNHGDPRPATPIHRHPNQTG
jgi:hypothetical protein